MRKGVAVFCLLMGFVSANAMASAGWGTPDFQMEIVGGIQAGDGEFPFIASMQYHGDHFCGGSLIAPQWVLTAAHCVVDTDMPNVDVVLGLSRLDQQGERHAVDGFWAHPQYSPSRSDYDFALVHLSTPSKYPAIGMQTVPLTVTNSSKLSGVVAGWGATRENGPAAVALQKVMLPLVTTQQCNVSYKGKITDRMLCAGFPAGAKDACQGDSGGPFIVAADGVHPLLAGVVSFGTGCARPGYYGVYSKVSADQDWIRAKLAGE